MEIGWWLFFFTGGGDPLPGLKNSAMSAVSISTLKAMSGVF